MPKPSSARRNQDILFVCGADRETNRLAIISEIKRRPDWHTAKTLSFYERNQKPLGLDKEVNASMFEVDKSLQPHYKAAWAINSADIAILEHLPGTLSEFVPATWRANCDLVCEIVTDDLETAFRQVRVHFLKHGYGETARRAEHVRVLFNGSDATEEFKKHEERTRLRYPPMNNMIANPGTRDDYQM
jgi:hypothetical protein